LVRPTTALIRLIQLHVGRRWLFEETLPRCRCTRPHWRFPSDPSPEQAHAFPDRIAKPERPLRPGDLARREIYRLSRPRNRLEGKRLRPPDLACKHRHRRNVSAPAPQKIRW